MLFGSNSGNALQEAFGHPTEGIECPVSGSSTFGRASLLLDFSPACAVRGSNTHCLTKVLGDISCKAVSLNCESVLLRCTMRFRRVCFCKM